MLSMRVKYGIRAILHLARNRDGNPIRTSDIAEKEAIPRKFLEAILVELRNAGMVRSQMGKAGGYKLERNPDTITLSQIIRMIDGPIAQVPCVSQMAYAPCKDCVDEKTCVLRSVMKQVRDSTARILDDTTFQDLLDREKQLQERDFKLDFQI